jgi:hypothetical protein
MTKKLDKVAVDAAKILGYGLLAGVALPALYSVGKDVAGSLLLPGKVEKSRDDMDKYYPQLKEYNQKDVNLYFDSLKSIAPQTASSPALAGAFVQRALEAGGVDAKMMGDIINVEEFRVGRQMPQIGKSFGESVAKYMGQAVVGGVTGKDLSEIKDSD